MGFHIPSTQPRITDLSAIDAEDFKRQNRKFLKGDAEYEQTEHDTYERLDHQISVTRNQDLRRVLCDFPLDVPLYEQCAGWMHAVAGKHFFPDANHRTALALLRTLLHENDIPPGRWPADVSRLAVLRSHVVRREVETVRLDTLYRHDRLFLVWILYFKTVLKTTVR